MTNACFALCSGMVLSSLAPLPAQSLDVSLPPGENFDKAGFRLWSLPR